MIDLNKVVRETMALRGLRAAMPHIVGDRPTLASGVPQVFADAHQIQQVLLNLLINAEQAMLAANGRGALVVRTCHDGDRDAVVLEVNDDGPGVPDDVQTQDLRSVLHDEGSRQRAPASASRSPTPSCRSMAAASAWSPTPGGGASFSVELPVSGGIAAREAARVRRSRWMSFEGASVLMVEDERALAAAVTEALTDAGLRVDHAGDGEEALARVRNANYDLS